MNTPCASSKNHAVGKKLIFIKGLMKGIKDIDFIVTVSDIENVL